MLRKDAETGAVEYHDNVPMETVQKQSFFSSRKTLITFIGSFVVIGLGVGLSVGLTVNSSKNSNKTRLPYDDSPPQPIPVSSLPSFNSATRMLMDGYSECLDYVSDLEEATNYMVNVHIDRMALQYYHNQYFWGVMRGGGGGNYYEDVVMTTTSVPESADKSTQGRGVDTSGGGDSGGGEDSYATNNQVEGVDEADVVKSDGTHVFAAYGDTLVVLDGASGTELSRTVIPTVDDEGISLCDTNVKSTVKCYQNYAWQTMSIDSLLLHENRLVVIARSAYSIRPLETNNGAEDDTTPAFAFNGQKATRIFVYDISSIPTGKLPLPLVKRQDLNGYYQSARSIGKNAHVVTSTSVNIWDHIYQQLEPNVIFKDLEEVMTKTNDKIRRSMKAIMPGYNGFLFDPERLSENQYRNAARAKATTLIPNFARMLARQSLGSSSTDSTMKEEDCSKIVRLALYSSQYNDDENSEEQETTTSASFTTTNVLSNFVQVTSFDILDDSEDDGGSSDKENTIATSTSGIFIPLNSYSKSIYSSSEKLVIAGEAYEEDSKGFWEEKTVLFAFHLDGSTTKPESIGIVPGSLLNQFSMDHYSDDDGGTDYLRVATTSWAQWGIVDDTWTQRSDSSSQVTVLNMTVPTLSSNDENSNLNNEMQIVGQVNNLGKSERIYAVRFMGDKAFVVTFRQIDPFYTLNMEDPTNPQVVGELKIPGFSNYLHPIGEDGNLILAVGQDADDRGAISGLQIAMYDVTDMSNPTQAKKFVEDTYSSSDAQYDHQAFRYLPQTEVLILPLRRSSFDGFVVYDVPIDPQSKIGIRFDISHRDTDYCWSQNMLTPRSLVFDGDVMTMMEHTILSHDLDTNKEEWNLSLGGCLD